MSQRYTPEQVAGAVRRLNSGEYDEIKGVQQRSVQPVIDQHILACEYLRCHADSLAALVVAEDVLAQLLDKHGGEGDQWNGLNIVRQALAKARGE